MQKKVWFDFFSLQMSTDAITFRTPEILTLVVLDHYTTRTAWLRHFGPVLVAFGPKICKKTDDKSKEGGIFFPMMADFRTKPGTFTTVVEWKLKPGLWCVS
jgi:hypothetical protein